MKTVRGNITSHSPLSLWQPDQAVGLCRIPRVTGTEEPHNQERVLRYSGSPPVLCGDFLDQSGIKEDAGSAGAYLDEWAAA